jgi:phosphatidylserine/phosphatidylglycerophosphate/cardiolipin synthase-like enzyme
MTVTGRAADEAGQHFASQATYQACFTPGGDCESMIVRAIDSAERRVHVQAYSFTDMAIAQALEAAARRGVEVIILLDKSQRHERSSVAGELVGAGLKVLCDDRPRIAHNKTIIIDPDGPHPAVETGSFNFSYSAEHRNAENALIVRDDQVLASAYEQYFQERLAASEPW